MISRQFIHVTGIVQGVGFRPFVYQLALEYQLNLTILPRTSFKFTEISTGLFLSSHPSEPVECVFISDTHS